MLTEACRVSVSLTVQELRPLSVLAQGLRTSDDRKPGPFQQLTAGGPKDKPRRAESDESRFSGNRRPAVARGLEDDCRGSASQRALR